MKKFISGFVAGAVIFCAIGAFAASYVADVAGFKVLVNGKEFVSDPPALVVEGRTYLPLRAIGDALGVPVNWNAELGQAEVGTAPESAKTETETEESGELSAEFKLFMDECNTFFDEYIEFMEEYEDTETVADEMADDYNDFMTKYNNIMSQMESVNQETLSQADIEYYNQTLTVITEKLAAMGVE